MQNMMADNKNGEDGGHSSAKLSGGDAEFPLGLLSLVM